MATKVSPEVQTNIASFAVEQYNKKENAMLRFVTAVEGTKQVVAGTEYSITFEAIDGKDQKRYEAKVSESMGLRDLLDFKPASTKAST